MLVHASLGAAHSLLDELQRGEDLFLLQSSADKLETDWGTSKDLRVIQVVAKFILVVDGLVIHILDILGGINPADRKDDTRIVKQVPLRGVAPVFGLLMRRGSAKAGGAENHVHLLAIFVGSCIPSVRIFCAVRVAFDAKLLDN